MTGDRWQRVQALFQEALQQGPEKRASFLADACRGDPELQTEVESLLACHDSVPAAFMRPPEPKSGTSGIAERPQPDLRVGSSIGRYVIKSTIASGGMGTVYLAHQESPRRDVALKVMRTGVSSRSALRRFQFESHILARLQHPHIAQVYEAGTHADESVGGPAVPYFALEYIRDARTIAQYAQEKQLSAQERLKMFAHVCDAVHHGHQRGVIHRDLKPQNILVDPSGRPKIIDFGVARFTDFDIAITTLSTEVGQLIGTLQYMSPEQLDVDPHDLDTRSDVYSLGVVLYELLCGQLPYDVTGTTIVEAARVIREESPTRPSTINRTLRGDVETIALKALEKDRERRYQSAAEFADDIRRCLDNRPIIARPPSVTYVTGKFIKRYKWQTAALAAANLAVAAVLILMFVAHYADEARREREVARVQAYGAKMGAAEAALQIYDSRNARRILDMAEKDLRGWEWNHLNSRVDQSICTFVDGEGGGKKILDIAVDLEGRWLAIPFPEREGSVWIYDVSCSDLKAELPCALHYPTAVAFNHDGSLLATASRPTAERDDNRGLVTVWEMGPASVPERITRWVAHEKTILALAFHPTDRLLASASGDHTIRLWGLSDLRGHRTEGGHAAIEPKATLRGHEDTVTSVAFRRDDRYLASGSHDFTVRIWDVDAAIADSQERESVVLRGHTDKVTSVVFSPDGNRLASASVDKTIRLWDVDKSVEQAAKRRVRAIQDERSGRLIGILMGHKEGVMAVAFDPNGRRLYSGGGDRAIRVWDVGEEAVVSDLLRRRDWVEPRREQIAALGGHQDPVCRLAVLPDGRIVSASRANGSVKLWLPDVKDVPRLRYHRTSVSAVAFSPDGQHVISAAHDDSLVIWDVHRCVPVAREFVRHQEGISDLVCWPRGDHKYMASATGPPGLPQGGRIILWNIDDPIAPKRVCELLPEEGEMRRFKSVAITEDGNRLAAGDYTGTIWVWETENGSRWKIITKLEGHTGEVNGLVFLDGTGRWLASAGDKTSQNQDVERNICIWDVASPKEPPISYAAHAGTVRALAVSSDGVRLASASDDGTVGLWSVDRSGSTPHLRFEGKLKGHTDTVYSVAFHPDPNKHRLFSGSADRTIKVWDLKTRVEVGTLRGHAGQVRDLAFDGNGERLASASAGFEGSDNVVRLWEASRLPETLLHQRAAAMRAHAEVRQLLLTAVPSLESAKEQLRHDQRLPPEVREAALKDFPVFLIHPRNFDERARAVLEHPDASHMGYMYALEWAKAASEMAPENDRFRETLEALHERAK